jgi:hypothetical protein
MGARCLSASPCSVEDIFEHAASLQVIGLVDEIVPAAPAVCDLDDAAVVDALSAAGREENAECTRRLAWIGELWARQHLCTQAPGHGFAFRLFPLRSVLMVLTCRLTRMRRASSSVLSSQYSFLVRLSRVSPPTNVYVVPSVATKIAITADTTNAARDAIKSITAQ